MDWRRWWAVGVVAWMGLLAMAPGARAEFLQVDLTVYGMD